MDAGCFELCNGERGREDGDQHVRFGEGVEDVVRDGFLFFPVPGVGVQVFGYEGAAGLLPFLEVGGVVGGGEVV